MTEVKLANGEHGTELHLPAGCLVCGGKLSLRVMPGSAWTYCSQCHWLARPTVHFAPEGIQLGHSFAQA